VSPKNKNIEKPNVAKPKKRKVGVASQPSSFPVAGSGTLAGELQALLESEERNTLFEGILQSSSDGILVVNRENEVVFANERFVEMWMIPQEIMASNDDTLLLQYVLDQLSDPQEFLQKVQQLYHSAEESFDTLYFKDGRIFDRLSRPMMQGMELRGRVWSFRDITQRKRAENELHESEERFRTILDNIEDGYYEVDLKGNLTFVNRAYIKMLGYDENELIGMNYRQYMSHETAEVVFQTFNRVYRSGIPEQAFDWEWICKDGTRRSVEISVSTSKSADGSIVGFCGIVRDISERKRVEDALAASEAELRVLFASMHDAVLVIDREGVYRKIAPTNPGLLVRPPEELLGKNLRDVFPAERAEAFRGIVQQVLDTKKNTQIEYDLIIDGRKVWFQTTVSPLNADSTLWVAHDITNRKQAEEAIRAAEENYRTIFESATVGIYQSTPQGHFRSVNPVMARIFGYDSPEDMVSSVVNIEEQDYIDPNDRREFQRQMKEQGEVREFTSLNKRKDGGLVWVQEDARAVKDSNGNILYYEGFVTLVSANWIR
jgi:PAS domain S-box-containing protein